MEFSMKVRAEPGRFDPRYTVVTLERRQGIFLCFRPRVNASAGIHNQFKIGCDTAFWRTNLRRVRI
jgi:hypothetical protein